MKIVDKLKNFFCGISNWFDQHWGPDRLSTSPRIIHSDSKVKNMLKDFRKLYYLRQKLNIAVTGGETCGKKSFVKTFEKARWLPVGKFLRINMRYFIEEYGYIEDVYSLQNTLDMYIEKCIILRAKAGELTGLNDRLVIGPVRTYKKPLITSMVAIFMCYLLGTMNQWTNKLINLLPNTWNEYAIWLVIMFCCIVVIALCSVSVINSVVSLWPPRWISKFKVSLKISELEADMGNNTKRREYNKNIIYVLCKLRWQIGHTVVFENLEVLGQEAFPKIAAHLCELNREINEYNNAWKGWDISPFRRPIRFLYIYRDDVIQLKKDPPLFDEVFLIRPNVAVITVFNELKKMFEREVSKGTKISLDEMFPFDYSYMTHISRYIVNRRLLNEIVQHYINEYEDFISRIQAAPSRNDLHKLFSFVVYGLFFPKDRAKFTSRTSVIFNSEDNKEDIDSQYRALFEYLISTSCPEPCRIDYLCMRFVDLRPELLEEHIVNYKQAYEKGDYQTALIFIEMAICCQPEDEQLHNERKKILQQEEKQWE